MNVSYVQSNPSLAFQSTEWETSQSLFFIVVSCWRKAGSVSPLQRDKRKTLKPIRLSASSGLLAWSAEMTPSYFCMRCIFSEIVSIHISEYIICAQPTTQLVMLVSECSLADHQVHRRPGLHPRQWTYHLGTLKASGFYLLNKKPQLSFRFCIKGPSYALLLELHLDNFLLSASQIKHKQTLWESRLHPEDRVNIYI